MNKTRVLIVDDDPGISRLAKMVLDQTDRFEAWVENHSSRALNTARKFKPDVVLMDVDMPGKNGGEVASELRSDSSLGNPLILFVTALVSKHESGSDAILSGGEHYLAKPWEPKTLIKSLDDLLCDRPLARA